VAADTQVIGATAAVVGTLGGARVVLVIQNPAGSAGSIRWGYDTTVSATKGILMLPGDAPVSFTSGPADSVGAMDVYAARVSADVTVNFVEA
jgi:hypothetical protein